MKPEVKSQSSVNRRKGGMKYRTLIHMAIKNLKYKRLRTILTASGVVIGIGSIAFLVSFALGLRNVVNDQIIGSKSVNTIDVTSPDATTVHINDANIHKIAGYSHVTEVSKSYIEPGKIEFNNSTADAVTYGVDDKYIGLVSPKIVAGKTNININESTEAVVNQALLKIIGINNTSQAIDKDLKLKVLLDDNATSPKNPTVTVKIKGVIDAGSGPEIYTSGRFIQKAASPDYAQLKVVSDNRDSVDGLRAQIESNGFVTQSPVDTINEINRLFSIFAFILAGFGGVGMVIAVLGMFNTLTISLLERTSEIGLLMSIGARRRDIKRLFMAEALLLSLLGGLGGIVGAWLIGTTINIFLTTLANKRGLEGSISIFSLPANLAIAMILFVLLVGYAVVFFPSRRAAKINPINALRHE